MCSVFSDVALNLSSPPPLPPPLSHRIFLDLTDTAEEVTSLLLTHEQVNAKVVGITGILLLKLLQGLLGVAPPSLRFFILPVIFGWHSVIYKSITKDGAMKILPILMGHRNICLSVKNGFPAWSVIQVSCMLCNQ